MNVDFADAAQRHFDDAELLRGEQRWPNADQLYGLAAECGLKAVMAALAEKFLDADSVPAKGRHRVHVDRLWAEFSTFVAGQEESKYASYLQQPNPFSDWSVDQRYWGSISIGEAEVEPHRQGACQAMGVLKKAKEDGRL